MSVEQWAIRETAWDDHEPEPVLLAMGPWRIELRGGELADVSFDGAPIVRSVRAVVRDRDWNTVPAVVESIDVLADGCDVRLSMRGLGADIHAIL
ncbi:MAG TPA: hypothetical protein VFE99_10105, partial [Agromyces sp.]|nr:hypothetical protein [Agromyces sp.]